MNNFSQAEQLAMMMQQAQNSHRLAAGGVNNGMAGQGQAQQGFPLQQQQQQQQPAPPSQQQQQQPQQPGGQINLTSNGIAQILEKAKRGLHNLTDVEKKQIQSLMATHGNQIRAHLSQIAGGPPNGGQAQQQQQQQFQQQPQQQPGQQQQQQQQRPQQQQQQSLGVAGGPRPPQQGQPGQQQGQPGQQQMRPPQGQGVELTAQQKKEQQVAMLKKLLAMSEQERNQMMAANPQFGQLWKSWQAAQAKNAAQVAAAAAAGGGAAGPGGAPTSAGLVSNAPALPNLQLPPGRARPQAGMPGGGGNGGPPGARPPPPTNNLALQQAQQKAAVAAAAGGSRSGSPAVPMFGPNGQPLNPAQQAAYQHARAQALAAQQANAAAANAASSSNSHLQFNSPSPYPNQVGPRPTLSTGIPAGPLIGTPSLVQRMGGGWDEAARAGGGQSGLLRSEKDGARDEGKKRKIRELVESVEAGEKIEDAVEDLLLELVDEMIESSVHFAARLAKHRKGSTLEVTDLQLHLQQNHNIRVAGMTTDEVRPPPPTTRRRPVLSAHAARVAAVNAARASAGAPRAR